MAKSPSMIDEGIMDVPVRELNLQRKLESVCLRGKNFVSSDSGVPGIVAKLKAQGSRMHY